MAAPSDSDLTPLSNLLSPARAHHIATTHLLSVFSTAPSSLVAQSPAATTLREQYADLYCADITVYENDGRVLAGHDGVEQLVERLVGKGGPFEGWGFVIRGEVKLTRDFVWVAWGFGPKVGEAGEVEVTHTGADGILLEKDDDGVVRIKVVYVIIDGASDARGGSVG